MTLDEKLYLNGINGATGEYLVPPMDLAQLEEMLTGRAAPGRAGGAPEDDDPNDPSQMSWLRRLWHSISQPHLGLPLDVNPEDVRESGWAVVFSSDEDQAVKDALAPLVEHRRRQIGDDSKVKVLEYRGGESRARWLARHGVGAGSVEPSKVPFYLLVVGDPSKIPFVFIHHIDVEYCVGCLHFDTAGEYQRYVESLIAYENGQARPRSREAVFFGTRHPFDKATQLSADHLVNPLAGGASGPEGGAGAAAEWGFQTRKIWGDAARKEALAGVFGPGAGAARPAFLFTASHGMGFPPNDPKQPKAQGALVCQDWPGFGSIGPEHYFAADDVPGAGDVHGLIAFCFACFGAGTPARDRFLHRPGTPPPAIAPKPFFSPLPKRLLTHPNGGALAWIGHVERAWGYSIVTPNAGAQLLPFRNAVGRILTGQPVGYAMKDLNERYAALSTSLSSMLEEKDFGVPVSNFELAAAWVERNDAEGYVVFGDPAVQLRVSDLAAAT
ncbi:MAG TPA: hypothetical protein VF668_19240 [Pyrinomonadaceae bacterium]|jgi:hypothetical protein